MRSRTHVLIRSDEEAMMDVSLDQAGLPDALLPQHDHLGINAHGRHDLLVRVERKLERKRNPGVKSCMTLRGHVIKELD